MANPLARVMMDQMSKKNGKAKTNNYGQTPEKLGNLGKREEAMISSVIHKTRGNPEVVGASSKPNYQGKKVQLQDLVKNTSVKEGKGTEKPLKNEENGTENPEVVRTPEQKVKNPYQQKEVKSSVIATPGKGVSVVSLKSLGKGNTP